jgi:subtilisin family serine protease
MKRSIQFIIPSILSLSLVLTACEVPRTDGGAGDVPALTTPAVQVSPKPGVTETAAAQPPTAAPVTPPPAVTELPPPISDAGLPETGPAASTAPPADAVVPGQILVKLTAPAAVAALDAEVGADNVVAAGVPSLDQRLREIGATSMEPVLAEVAQANPDQSIEGLVAQAGEVSQLYTVNFPPELPPQEAAQKLAQDPTVEFAEPVYIAGIAAEPAAAPQPLAPNDPLYGYQWNMLQIQMPAAWDSSTGQDVIVAVIDTGIDFGAPDLAQTQRLPGYDFANNDTDPTDDQGHGTHVAGTIAQSTNNGVGVTGIAFKARLLPVKTLGANGQGSYDNIIKGITYAVDQGAKVINMSLAGRTGSQALLEAVRNAYNRGVVVVAAAGNSSGPVEYPAAYDEFVIGVGAVRFDKIRAPYSNFGPQVDLMAPGGDNKVDQNNDNYADGILQQTRKADGTYGYLFFEGTSMASPHVAGLSALILARKPNAAPAEVEALMTQTAQNLGSPTEMGAGLIQAANALAAIGGPTPLPPTFTPVVTAPPPPLTFTPTSTPLPPPTLTPIPPPATLTPTPTPLPPPTFTPVPPPAITPTAPPVLPAGELLLNGGFESDQAWVFGDTPIRGGYDTAVKLSGNRSARLGAVTGPDIFSYSSVWQRVAIPAQAGTVVLRINLFPVSQDAPGSGDVQNIMILNNRFQVIRTLSKELSNSQAWEARAYDVSDLKGQTIYVYFGVVNTGGAGKLTAMYVDDVSLKSN